MTTIKRRISTLSKTINKRFPYVCTSDNVGMSSCATSLINVFNNYLRLQPTTTPRGKLHGAI